MKITVKLDKNYGAWVVYPVCQQAQLFAAIAGTKTLKKQTLKLLQKLGYEIEFTGMNVNWEVTA